MNEYWSYAMPDGYLAPTENTAISDFVFFSVDSAGLPYNGGAWKIKADKNDGYPFIANPEDSRNNVAFLYAKTNGAFIAGSPFLKTQDGKSIINSAFVKE